MEPSPVERSANHFGVHLRKVGIDSSDANERTNANERKSMPPGVPSNCESKAYQRRSANISSSQVALRQEIAEKHAIDRHKKLNTRSLEKRLRPSLPPKPVLKTSSSLGNIPRAAAVEVMRKSTASVQRKSPLVKGDKGIKSKANNSRKSVDVPTPISDSDKTLELSSSSWLDPLYGSYEEYRPVFEALYLRVAEAVNKQAKLVRKVYINYQKEFNREARKWRNVRLAQRAMHGHRFLAVGVPQPTWCDKCADIIWGRCTVCLQCVSNSLGHKSCDQNVVHSRNHKNTESLKREQHQEGREESIRGNSLLTNREAGQRVTTDSEEELLTQILLSMSHSTSTASVGSREDESDYANLWDSESGASGSSTFQTNGAIMGSLLRKKVDGQLSQDTERRRGWVSTSACSDSSASNQPNEIPFDMDKFRSLQAKAENLDLTLTDFFSDLKHSSSILELSKMFSSTQMLSSNDCKFKCHQHCEDSLSNQCTGPITDKSQRSTDQWTDSKHMRHDADDADSGYSGSGGSAGFTLTKEEICSKITAYNESVGRSSGAMTLPSKESDSFQGCIKVCVCIDRPISMSLSSRPTSIFEALHREGELSPQTSPKNTVAAEHLPHNAQVSLHTNSLHTASEVVSILLNKFKITDNPKSFALFEQTIQYEKEVKLRKVGDQERPLLNYLRWSTECNDSKRFVLKENDSGDIMYEAFSIPELNNFLRVLEQEEAVKLTDIQNKYQVRRKQLADRIRELDLDRSTAKPSSLRAGR